MARYRLRLNMAALLVARSPILIEGVAREQRARAHWKRKKVMVLPILRGRIGILTGSWYVRRMHVVPTDQLRWWLLLRLCRRALCPATMVISSCGWRIIAVASGMTYEGETNMARRRLALARRWPLKMNPDDGGVRL